MISDKLSKTLTNGDFLLFVNYIHDKLINYVTIKISLNNRKYSYIM